MFKKFAIFIGLFIVLLLFQNCTAIKLFITSVSHGDAASGLLSGVVLTNGQDVTIASGDVRWLDSGMNTKYINNLTIEGTLKCPTGAAQNVILKVVNIHIANGGIFDCGRANARVLGKINIRLMQDGSNGGREIMVMNGGRLYLHGDPINSGYSYLSSDLTTTTQSLNLSNNVNWKQNDLIGISSSGFDYDSAETISLSDGNGTADNSYTLSNNPSNKHLGESSSTLTTNTQLTYGGAVAVNLTRNITIQSHGTVIDSKGGHLMIMAGAFAYIDSVSFMEMGRQYVMAHYPVHWHQAGNVLGQYIKNSVIYKSFQRCIVIHETDGLTVHNNVCYDHFGHGIFLESGNERSNIITHNVVMKSKKILKPSNWTGVNPLASEVDGTETLGRWHSPASFWITHPFNTITNNIAAGSEGTGFWMSFKDQTSRGTNPFSHYTPDNYFANNKAHSNRVGFTWDGVDTGTTITPSHYSPRHPNVAQEKPVYRRLVAYKNSEAGVYFRGDAALFYENLLADNRYAFFVAYSQEIRSSTILGFTEKMTDTEKTILKDTVLKDATSTTGGIGGVLVYDGPVLVNDVIFNDFPSSKLPLEGGSDITPYPFINIGGHRRYPGIVQGLQFPSSPIHKLYFRNGLNATAWVENSINMALIDLDGTLSGTNIKKMIYPDTSFHSFNCTTNSLLYGAKVCDQLDTATNYRFELLNSQNQKMNTEHIFFSVKNPDNDDFTYTNYSHSNKLNANNRETYSNINSVYKITPRNNTRLAPGELNFHETTRFRVLASSQGSFLYPAKIYIHGKRNCSRIAGAAITRIAPSSNQMNLFHTTQGSAYAPVTNPDGSYGLYLKIQATTVHPWHRHAALADVRENYVDFFCNSL